MTESDGKLIYRSKSSFRSLWNTYSVFTDRIELEFNLFFTTFVIRRSEFVGIDIYRPPVIRTSFGAIKLDFADLFTHVGIVRNCGWFKELRFTPANPKEFKRAVLAWLNLSSRG